jgi:3-isopropylmalate/(R)-2-methylmalate dehydratase small subunit
MQPFRTHTGSVAPLDRANVDTDQIIPKQFLKRVERTGFGQFAFYDWRFNPDGTPNGEFVLNHPRYKGASVLVAAKNFGCGSSREHAPWALADYGIHAVLSSEIADIFRGNALKNGLLAVVLSEGEHRYLLEHPGIELAIDVAGGFIELPDGGRFTFELEPFARHCLLSGVDQLGFLLQHESDIDAFENAHKEAA